MKLKINILYDFKTGPWGGGNQFLKALRQSLIKQKNYSEDPENADVIIFNSHHFGENLACLKYLINLKQSIPKLRLIHRLDGPVSLIRGGSKSIDTLIFDINSKLADGTVFQTNWSRKKSFEMSLYTKHVHRTIINAPNDEIFPRKTIVPIKGKIKLINTSWAANERKGVDILKYLDQELDFSRFQMTFVGNINADFKNINVFSPKDSAVLAEILRSHDIFIAPSINDPCSNALCEALHTGLPALARDSGGHPELVGNGGVLFQGTNDILKQLDLLTKSYSVYQMNIAMPNINVIAKQYIDFAADLMKQEQHLEKIDVNAVRIKTKLYYLKQRFKNVFPKQNQSKHL